MTGIELEKLEDQAQVIIENQITPDQFFSFYDFFHASHYGIEKSSKLWTNMLSKRDKWVEV